MIIFIILIAAGAALWGYNTYQLKSGKFPKPDDNDVKNRFHSFFHPTSKEGEREKWHKWLTSRNKELS